MGTFSLSGGVEVVGFISPTDPLDTYPVIDPLYGIDGLRNVNLISDLNNIPELRRRAGMVVGVSGGTAYYKLNNPPWNYNISDWSVFNSGGGSSVSGDYLPLSGGTVTGGTVFTQGVTANTVSATTYLNLPIDLTITGFSYSNNTFTLTNNSGDTLSTTFNSVTGLTVNGILSATTISGGTLFGDGSNLTGISTQDTFVTGGTYSNGTAEFTNNTGGTFNVVGFYTGETDNNQYVTGFTYQDNTFTISDNSGSTFNATINSVTGLTVNGDLISNNFSGTTNYIPKFTPNSYSLGNSIITNNSNNVSIGTITTPYRFYVLGVNTTAGQPLFVVRDTGRIGINTTAPNAELTIQNTNPTTTQDILTLRNNSTGIGTGNSIRFINSATPSSTVGSKIESIITNLSGRNSLKFYVHGGGGSFGALQERMTIDGTGNVFANQFNGLTVSATTYLNLPVDVFVTGGTYSSDTLLLTNNTGGTFNVTGFTTSFTGGTVTGDTIFQNGLTATTISATTYQNLPTDVRVTGATYNNNTFTYTNNTGGTFNILFNTVTGLTVNGNLSVTGNTNVRALTGTSAFLSGSAQNVLTVVGSGTTSPIFTVQGSSGELFSINDSLIGSLFSVNNISGLPILEVFDDDTILMGSYVSPSLNTTKRLTLSAGTNTVYSIPTSAYTGMFVDYTLTSSVGVRAGNVMSIWSGSTAEYTDVSTNDIGTTTGVTFSVVISGNNAVITSSATTSNWTLKTIIRGI